MKLHFLHENMLENLRENIETNLHNYKSDSNKWIFEFFENDNSFLELVKEMPQFKLNMSYEKPQESDIENVKMMYTKLKNLTNVEASDERLWAGMAHSDFWDYMRYRLSFDKKEPDMQKIKNSYFFSSGRKKSLIQHKLSRLWWIGKLVYDEERKDAFELLQVFNTDFFNRSFNLFFSNFSNSQKITKVFLETILEFEKNGVKIKREIFNDIIIRLDVLGGSMILDYLDKNELKHKISEKIENLLYT